MNEWRRIRTLIITWLDGEVRFLWLRTSHIVLAQSFSNPLVRSDLPHLLPLKHEKKLLLHPWPVPEKALSTGECLGMERDEGINFAAVASLAITVVPERSKGTSSIGRATACLHLEERVLPFCPKASSGFLLTIILLVTSLPWLPYYSFCAQSQISPQFTLLCQYTMHSHHYAILSARDVSLLCPHDLTASSWILINPSTSIAQDNFSQT